MRVLVAVKANADSEAGKMPSEHELAEMGKFNEELVKAGVMLAGEGLHPSSKGKRVRFSVNPHDRKGFTPIPLAGKEPISQFVIDRSCSLSLLRQQTEACNGIEQYLGGAKVRLEYIGQLSRGPGCYQMFEDIVAVRSQNNARGPKSSPKTHQFPRLFLDCLVHRSFPSSDEFSFAPRPSHAVLRNPYLPVRYPECSRRRPIPPKSIRDSSINPMP